MVETHSRRRCRMTRAARAFGSPAMTPILCGRAPASMMSRMVSLPSNAISCWLRNALPVRELANQPSDKRTIPDRGFVGAARSRGVWCNTNVRLRAGVRNGKELRAFSCSRSAARAGGSAALGLSGELRHSRRACRHAERGGSVERFRIPGWWAVMGSTQHANPLFGVGLYRPKPRRYPHCYPRKLRQAIHPVRLEDGRTNAAHQRFAQAHQRAEVLPLSRSLFRSPRSSTCRSQDCRPVESSPSSTRSC